MFNESFVFAMPLEELRHRTLQFSVYDFDRFSRNDLIGHVIVKRLYELCDVTHEMEYIMDIAGAPQVSYVITNGLVMDGSKRIDDQLSQRCRFHQQCSPPPSFIEPPFLGATASIITRVTQVSVHWI